MITAKDFYEEITHKVSKFSGGPGDDITTDNSFDLDELVEDYKAGKYDDDRELLIQRVEHLVQNHG